MNLLHFVVHNITIFNEQVFDHHQVVQSRMPATFFMLHLIELRSYTKEPNDRYNHAPTLSVWNGHRAGPAALAWRVCAMRLVKRHLTACHSSKLDWLHAASYVLMLEVE